MIKPNNFVGPVKPTTPVAASRMQSATAKKNEGHVAKGSAVGRMQAAAVRNFGKSGAK